MQAAAALSGGEQAAVSGQRAFIRRFAVDAAAGFSTSAAAAWRDLFSVLQAGNAQLELAAYVPAALEQQRCELFMP